MIVLRNILAALCLAALGVYILRTHSDTLGLVAGGLAVLGALGIAFPTQMESVGPRLKGLLVVLIPIAKGAMPGGDRKDDPPAPKANP